MAIGLWEIGIILFLVGAILAVIVLVKPKH